jgi:hypothetical protein
MRVDNINIVYIKIIYVTKWVVVNKFKNYIGFWGSMTSRIHFGLLYRVRCYSWDEGGSCDVVKALKRLCEGGRHPCHPPGHSREYFLDNLAPLKRASPDNRVNRTRVSNIWLDSVGVRCTRRISLERWLTGIRYRPTIILFTHVSWPAQTMKWKSVLFNRYNTILCIPRYLTPIWQWFHKIVCQVGIKKCTNEK